MTLCEQITPVFGDLEQQLFSSCFCGGSLCWGPSCLCSAAGGLISVPAVCPGPWPLGSDSPALEFGARAPSWPGQSLGQLPPLAPGESSWRGGQCGADVTVSEKTMPGWQAETAVRISFRAVRAEGAGSERHSFAIRSPGALSFLKVPGSGSQRAGREGFSDCLEGCS